MKLEEGWNIISHNMATYGGHLVQPTNRGFGNVAETTLGSQNRWREIAGPKCTLAKRLHRTGQRYKLPRYGRKL